MTDQGSGGGLAAPAQQVRDCIRAFTEQGVWKGGTLALVADQLDALAAAQTDYDGVRHAVREDFKAIQTQLANCAGENKALREGPAHDYYRDLIDRLAKEIHTLNKERKASPTCPHRQLPAVLPAVCTPEIKAVQDAQIARDGEMFDLETMLKIWTWFLRKTEPPVQE